MLRVSFLFFSYFNLISFFEVMIESSLLWQILQIYPEQYRDYVYNFIFYNFRLGYVGFRLT